jgi:dienelactone hydrolase/pimeloyl-ACP methyl ester carboxylesterase
MRTLALVALLALVQLGIAQDDLTVLKETNGVPPRKMLYEYLRGECQKHFDARRQVVARLKTPEDVRARQKMLRAKFIEAIGGLPERTPLNARVVGHLKGDGFRVEKVIYESRPNHHVTAVLYLPEPLYGGQLAPRVGSGWQLAERVAHKDRIPGVLVPCGHSANGKAAEAYQRACILMAKNGLAVLCYDPIGQGERIQLLTAGINPAARIAGSTSEHTMCGIGALLVGRSTAHYRIWDGIRSLDYLASRPEVDPERLGCTGNSGGGTLTAYLMALDDRIKAAAPSCYITSLERLFATIGPQDAEQNITGQVAFGMEHADYITMRAPKPTLILTGTRDFFDIQGAWTTFREAKRIYGLLGQGDRVDFFEYDDEHGWSKPRREAAAKFMVRWLLGKDVPLTEPDFPIFKDAELQCTGTGQVLEDFKGKSVFDLNAEREAELVSVREKWLAGRSHGALEKQISLLIGVLSIPAPSAPKVVDGVIERGGYRVMKYIVCENPSLPALLVGNDDIARPKVIYLHDQGMAADATRGGPIEALAKDGKNVIAFDLPGFGETAPIKPPQRSPDYFGLDAKEAFLGLHLGRPLLGHRLEVAWRPHREKVGGEVAIVGKGNAGPIVLHLAVLDPRYDPVTLENSLLSWSAVVRSPISVNQLTNVVPGVLQYYDLPDLAALIAPRPLTIKNPVDAQGRPVSQAELESVYAKAIAAYKKAGAEKALVLVGKK